MEPAINTAQRRANLKCQPLSNYFEWIEDINPCRAVLLARESTRPQAADGNLNWHRTYYRQKCRERGFTFLRSYGEIGSGWKWYRPTLVEACSYARRHGAIVVAEAVNRFLRPERYHPEFNPDADYEYEELERIANIARGVTLATFIHPDMPERMVHGLQIQRGLMKPPARGSTKAKNDLLRDTVEALHDEGYSPAEIKRQTGVPSSNISRWTPGVDL